MTRGGGGGGGDTPSQYARGAAVPVGVGGETRGGSYPTAHPRARRAAQEARSIVSESMSVRIGTGLSTVPDGRTAALEASSAAAVELGGEPCELVIVFVSGSILSAPDAVLEAVQEILAPESLIGCGGG